MCKKCDEIDDKIERYRRIASRTTDQAVLDGIDELVERLNVEKGMLHSEEGSAGKSRP